MLNKLIIKNLAIIEDAEISFSPYFNALTGATGAGKSLVIDSLKLIFGKRADSDLIRYGSDEASVLATFTNLNDQTKAYLKTLDIESDTLTILRVISKKDKNMVVINDKPTTLNELKNLSLLIGDIHEQHDTLKLLDPNTYLDILDSYGAFDEIKNSYVLLRHGFFEAAKNLDKAKAETSKNDELLDLYKYQLDELHKSKLDPNELALLEKEITALTHQEKILSNLNIAYKNLVGIDEDNLIFEGVKAIEKVETYETTYGELKKRLESAYYELDDIKEELFGQIDLISNYNVLELDNLKERFYFLKELEVKYSKSISELIDYQAYLESEILRRENFEAYTKKLALEKDMAYQKAYQKGLELHEARIKVSKRLEKDFVLNLKELAIDYVLFEVEVKENQTKELLETGIDEITFLLSLNEGEPVKPFHKIASGGELSRSMLALKILYGNSHDLGLMVFDEIDLGISGYQASRVAHVLKDLSTYRQVITITHLPQVAAKADKHFDIKKQPLKGRTVTLINELQGEDRVTHIAYMLSGSNITEGAILHAKSLIK